MIDRHQETIEIQAPPDEVYDLISAIDHIMRATLASLKATAEHGHGSVSPAP